MAIATLITFDQFLEKYGDCDRSYEFWYGEAIPRGKPTVVHGLLQQIIMRLLYEAGLIAASEVELRADPEAHPRPDVIARGTKFPVKPYPTEGLEVVVEVTSENDKFQHLREKCRRYQKWGCRLIYEVDPSASSGSAWSEGSFILPDELANISVPRFGKSWTKYMVSDARQLLAN